MSFALNECHQRNHTTEKRCCFLGMLLFGQLHNHVFICSSYLGPSGGNYGVINNSRMKRRPSSHLEMEISECEFLRDLIQNQILNVVTAY